MALITKQQIQNNDLSKQEIGYLLRVLSETKFEGKDVLIVHSVITKLQTKLNEKA
jgi:hypothetical protein